MRLAVPVEELMLNNRVLTGGLARLPATWWARRNPPPPPRPRRAANLGAGL